MAGGRARASACPPTGPLITFVGRIQPLKAPDVMLRAVALLLERRPDAPSARSTVAVVGGPSGSGSGASRLAGPPGRGARHRPAGAVRACRWPRTSWSTGTPRRRWSACRRTTRASGWSPSRRRPPARRSWLPRSVDSPPRCATSRLRPPRRRPRAGVLRRGLSTRSSTNRASPGPLGRGRGACPAVRLGPHCRPDGQGLRRGAGEDASRPERNRSLRGRSPEMSGAASSGA